MGFTNHNKETIKKTQQSYFEAVSKAIDLFGNLGRSGSGYSYWIGDNMEAMGAYLNIEKANDFIVDVKSLFDFRDPKIIQERHTLYRSTFFKVTLYWIHPFTVYHYESGVVRFDPETNEKERVKEAHIAESEQRLRVHVCSRSFGIKHFKENPDEIENWINKAQDESVKNSLMEKFNEAKEEIEKWKEAQRKQYEEIMERI